MKKAIQFYSGLFICFVSHAYANAEDIKWNGFLSAVGGTTLNESTLPNGAKSQFNADTPSDGTYQDHLTFEPDTIYGLQGRAEIDEKLSITAQITGTGGQDFDAQIKWAYLSYDLNNTYTLQAGRQRIPIFFYSDYLDVGYAYHWIRPPTEVYTSSTDVFEGVQLLAKTPFSQNWDATFQAYGGKADNLSQYTDETYTWLNMYGVVGSVHNDWFQLRANYLNMQHASTNGSWNNKLQDEDNGGVPLQFWGVAAHADFENAFLGAEVILAKWDEPFRADQGQGLTKWHAFFITAGYRFGQFTPHITFGKAHYTIEDSSLLGGIGLAPKTHIKSNSWTTGVRWDFHPSAALKLEYVSRNDTSDKGLIDVLGQQQEVDLISAGVDVLF